jgi:succinoglycan biosynthesis protein ExoA
MAPLAVPPAVALAASGLLLSLPFGAGWLLLALPALIWALACLGGGALLALRARRWPVLWAGPAAMAMHLGWGTGFLLERLRQT